MLDYSSEMPLHQCTQHGE